MAEDLQRATLPRDSGRDVFGLDPAGYAAGRPGYPATLFEALERQGALGPGTATVEVGPGTGQATGELLERGASPLVLVEPSAELGRHLRERFGDRVVVREATFETAELPDASFDLVAAATSFHWVDTGPGLERAAAVLREGGLFAAWWTIHHDPDAPHDPLYLALEPILDQLPRYDPGGGVSASGYATDLDARCAEIRATGRFAEPAVQMFRWELPLDTASARALFATFSPVLALTPVERTAILDQIADVVERRFGGSYARTCVTVLYTATRLR
ncbi:MAG: class I SAM-dependent methyltransferase [Gaiellales bacterium]